MTRGEAIGIMSQMIKDEAGFLSDITVKQNGNRYQDTMHRHKYMDVRTDNIDNYTDIITSWDVITTLL